MLALLLSLSRSHVADLHGALTANKVHDDRDDRKQQKKMNEKSGRLESQKAPDPDKKQNDSENEKHRCTFFLCHA